jgi:hypothetical protein
MVPLGTLLGTHDNGGAARRRPPFFRTKKVGLLGSTDSLKYAPWDDPTWTLIAHPCCRPRCKREPDWYFDMHRPECFRKQKKQWNAEYYQWLQSLQTPIFMQENWPEIAMAVRYPLEQIEAEYACTFTAELYATNHCAFMFPLAMREGVEQIGLFGCQYAGGERGTQRESLIYWIGRFEQAGGRMVVPRKFNSLMTQPLYGYASHDEKGKLVPEYRPTIAVETNKTPTKLTLVDPDNLGTLMELPNGEQPNLDRLRELMAA